MGEEYEALGPAAGAPPAPPTIQFPIPQPPSPFPPSPGQPEVFQFPPQPLPSALTPGEQKKQLKKDGIGDKAEKEKSIIFNEIALMKFWHFANFIHFFKIYQNAIRIRRMKEKKTVRKKK
ncbi:unnamed protein product [Wuchereria bancrofti]|uniref:Uncharacterized protein n=1 Tax=Wuchereria bancrofti TaxID=6293 RepID=A0A3P7FD11_WUCBA|nr:unnamed protein product [Wuchereria bancrofti]